MLVLNAKYFFTQVHFQNHVAQKIKRWVHSKDGSVSDQQTYIGDFRWLIRAEFREIYLNRLQEVRRAWDSKYMEYFMKYVDPEVEKLAVLKLKEWGMPIQSNSTITSNQCETINMVFKDVQNWDRVGWDDGAIIAMEVQKAKCYEMGLAFQFPDGEY